MNVGTLPDRFAGHAQPTYDPGPPPIWDALFAQAPLQAYARHTHKHFHCGFGPVFYRGRLDGSARILVVGQDPSVDELFARRVLVGRSGQRVQGLLHKAGIGRDYAMLNTFLCGVKHPFDTSLRQIALEPEILSFRDALFDKITSISRLEVILTLGDAAYFAIQHWSRSHHAHMPVIAIAHPSLPHQEDAEVLRDWNRALTQLRLVIRPEHAGEVSPYGQCFTDGDLRPIPRCDLPFGMPAWLGTGGTRGMRALAERITWAAPAT